MAEQLSPIIKTHYYSRKGSKKKEEKRLLAVFQYYYVSASQRNSNPNEKRLTTSHFSSWVETHLLVMGVEINCRSL